MDYALPLIFMAIMGVALLVYVVLDGYDLGIGLLTPLATESEKDTMIASIGPYWDANETWIVLGVGVLLIAFPVAHGIVLTSLYLPATIMLMGLILRGVAFDFRVKAGDHQRRLWNYAFFVGSLIASTAQGWMLGAYVTGLTISPINIAFSCLIALTLPALYVVLGAAWLMIKTEGELLEKAVKWGRVAVVPMGVALLCISIATPLVSPTIADKWFVLPNIIGLLPIPLICVITFSALIWLMYRIDLIQAGYGWLVMAGTVLICVMAALGLAYSLFPYIVIDKLTVWQAASATNSLLFVLVGVVIVLPAIIGYTIFVYKVFSGKATTLSYGSK
ncbi:MAG: cytochrome d ubiquinol oxidase subunit II [Gammaproteobacteria bacterium]|nr:cytochrome d ubiquinol oxidase subunit II [Gammaproteobacteria bacterium]